MAVTVDSAGRTTATTKADQRRAMGQATEEEKRAHAAYEAGRTGIDEADHFGGRDDVSGLERESFEMGRQEHGKGRRRARAGTAVKHARSVAGTSGGYLARAGRSVVDRTGDIPSGGSGGSWVGVLVGVLALIALYLLLTKANLAATVIGGVSKGVMWLAAPKILPF